MAVARASGEKGRCDTLFSKIIRSTGSCLACDYRCPYECEPSSGTHRKGCKLQCAHIISRHLSNTRCVTTNAYPLCAGCHHRFTLWPLEFADFVLANTGREAYDALARLARSKAKVIWANEKARLETIFEATCRPLP